MVGDQWVTMPDARKRPCCICRRWFRPDSRIGSRQRACRSPECQTARRVQTQRSWRESRPDYFIAYRMRERGEQPAEFAGKTFLTEKETAELEARTAKNRIDQPPKEGDQGTYNQFWFDRGTKAVSTHWTSLIIDPPDGQIPPLT